MLEVESDSTTNSEEDANVAFTLVDQMPNEGDLFSIIDEVEANHNGPYEFIEGLMQSKVGMSQKQELMAKMLYPNLLTCREGEGD